MPHSAAFYFTHNYCIACKTKVAKDPTNPFKIVYCPECNYKMRVLPRGSKYKAKYKAWRRNFRWQA